MYRHRFEKSQRLVSDMKQSNDLLNQQVEKAHLERTKEKPIDKEEIVRDGSVTDKEVVDKPIMIQVTSTDTEKVTTNKSEKEVRQQKNTAKSQNTLVWDGQTYEVKERKIKSKQYLVVTKALDGEERWIFPMDGSSPVGKVTNGRKCFFLESKWINLFV